MNIATSGKKMAMVWPVLGVLGNLSSGFFSLTDFTLLIDGLTLKFEAQIASI